MWNPLFSFGVCDSNANYHSNGSVDNNSAASPGGLWSDIYSPTLTTTVATSNALPYINLDESYPNFLPSLENVGPPPLAPQLIMGAATPTNPFNRELCTSTTTTTTSINEFSELFHRNEPKTTAAYGQELSTEDVMRTAAFHFIQMSPRREELPLLLTQPFGLLISGLASNEVKNVELATALLAAAEKLSHQQHAQASSILAQCDRFSSNTGNPVERVVYYFSQALHERIRCETGTLPWKKKSKHVVDAGDFAARNVIKEMLARHPVHVVAHYSLPFSQILQFTSVQAMLDRISNAKRIHIVDLSIKHGHQWTILMQVFAMRSSCHVELLKISAVASSLDATANVASRLSGFAESLRLPFKFNTVVVPDLKDLRESSFLLEEGEAVGVYSGEALSGLISTPDRLDNLMRVVQKLKPIVLTVIDVEAKHNSSSFASRFVEALFYFSALFDCLDGMMERGDGNRKELEGIYYSQSIRSIVANEGREREVRHVGIDVWRRFFPRFGLVEAELSDWSLHQAGMLLKQFGNGESCTLEKNGRSLLIGWKGTPIKFASAWMFQRGEGSLL